MKSETVCDRRTFLRKAAILGGSAALLLGTVRPAATIPPVDPPRREGAKRGYRVTEQVRRYYERARA